MVKVSYKLKLYEKKRLILGVMHLSSASPRGEGPRADLGEYGDFMGGGGNVGT